MAGNGHNRPSYPADAGQLLQSVLICSKAS